MFNGSKILLKPGSFITSRLKLSHQSGIQESKVERILKYLETEQQIEQQNMSTGRLISITNWLQYQNDEQQTELPVNSERTASEQRVNTNKNERMKEVNTLHQFSPDFLEFWELYPKKVGKAAAARSWKVHCKNGELSRIRETLAWQIVSDKWTEEGGKFIPNPETYLNQERWLDEPNKPVIAPQKRLPL